jgi:hypothetical protein
MAFLLTERFQSVTIPDLTESHAVGKRHGLGPGCTKIPVDFGQSIRPGYQSFPRDYWVVTVRNNPPSRVD